MTTQINTIEQVLEFKNRIQSISSGKMFVNKALKACDWAIENGISWVASEYGTFEKLVELQLMGCYSSKEKKPCAVILEIANWIA